MKAIVIGGGIVGLSSALYLKQSGWEVTLIDRSDLSDNCSYGNAGYVCPSHFVPLATPGIIKQGLKWMWNSRSPFYVQPRLSRSLIDWGIRFMQSATPDKVKQAALPLRDIALLSQQAYTSWTSIPGIELSYEHKGLMEYFQTPEKEEHAHHFCEDARALGLEASMLSYEEVQALEPQTRLQIKGALWFKCDAHVYPNKVMASLIRHLRTIGVQFRTTEQVKGFEKKGGKITRVLTDKGGYEADQIVLASGSWSRELAAQLGLRLPLVGGRGYSITLENSPNKLNHPAVLMEGRVALTPMDGNKIRFGGTMEITSLNQPPRLKRVEGILNAVQRYFPDFQLPSVQEATVWSGFRPCSADGLPYIGRSSKWNNLLIATGHAMVGMSLGAGTGQLISELANEQTPSMDLSPFNPERFA
ncbi:FAD-dependent oxidoreductase [Flavihumibacter sp. CACIAM 22H1]|uniref:NAD(P)/FAD-dependent oxidoreductase n=1 Tax=Flavihumibacter sp. CACIAM 22H1 TaxID=1812911 RepID=UPI0007A92674|nr:FAD-dependent oxidoreductase [Flavihumibacter sp. CACIAM 22H1]KYP14939.1 MAG: FAD-dependent oxidoreductase [Flavihumibacter sp. CACIAM 22H1]